MMIGLAVDPMHWLLDETLALLRRPARSRTPGWSA